MVSRDLLPMARGCAGPRVTGKPLELAVDDVPPTASGRSNSAKQVMTGSTGEINSTPHAVDHHDGSPRTPGARSGAAPHRPVSSPDLSSPSRRAAQAVCRRELP